MRNTIRAAAVLLAALLVLCSFVPALAAGTEDYNQHDVEKLRAFFNLQGQSSYTNGRAINGDGYDENDPSTWTSCTWTSGGRLETISFSNCGWAVVGDLDLSDCTALTNVTASDCFMTGINVTGCPELRRLVLTGDRITELDVTTNPKLELLWFKQNSVSHIDITNCHLLQSFDCTSNNISVLDVTQCPQLTILRASNNSIGAIDVSNCPLLTELNIKSNLLSALDISNLTQLIRIYCFGNLLTKLDLSVMNGGVSYEIKAVGSGYIGTKCYTDPEGQPVIHGSSEAMEGESFLGWYVNGECISTEEHTPCLFGQGPIVMEARFAGSGTGLAMGDLNGDGQVNSTDALMMLRYTMGMLPASMLHLEVGDMNGDGYYNSTDALIIMRIAFGII